jgi:hypothetical protein
VVPVVYSLVESFRVWIRSSEPEGVPGDSEAALTGAR